jgi:hypothetical protein
MSKLEDVFQQKFANKQFFNESVLKGISKSVKLHDEVNNVRSSAAACLNVMGYLNQHQKDIIPFFSYFGIQIEEVIPFPQNVNVGDEIYDDKGPIVFEWIGPKKSPINEKGGSRGQNRTSIDAFMLAKIFGKTTQIFIEWKFTENYSSESYNHKFSGTKGIERLRRYSTVLSALRNDSFPFNFKEEDTLGLVDFSYEPFYQLLRMTLLARKTTPIKIADFIVDDYAILHLSHSSNAYLETLSDQHLKYSPGLKKYISRKLHDTWKELLSDKEKQKFYFSYWDKALCKLTDNDYKQYLCDRYE